MILEFPDHDTLRLALTSGAIEEAVHTAPAAVATGTAGQVWIRCEAKLTTPSKRALKRLGVRSRRSLKQPFERTVTSWLQAFPVQRGPIREAFGEKTPVLFELPDAESLSVLVNEMLRLGNDRQSYRAIATGDGDERILLRVIGPPYYSLLRAFDRNGSTAAPRAYVERAPRVWFEVGCHHPFEAAVKPSPGTWQLIGADDQWRSLPEAPFEDVFAILDFRLPDAATALAPTELDRRLEVPVRLVRGGPAEGGELWVLEGEGIDQLDAFVQASPDRLLERLAFAVGEFDGRTTVVVRVRPGRTEAPVLVLDGLACTQYLKLPNLFVPVGTRLHPSLRRDAVKELLLEDDAQLVWLQPGDGESFTPRSLPDAAFRPLSDFVDYVIDRDFEQIDAWMAASRFEFERFICPDERRERRETPKPEKPKKPQGKRPKSQPPVEKPDSVPLPEPSKPVASLREYRVEKPAERRVLEERLRAVEAAYRDSPAEADAEERTAQWREMARLNAVLGHHADAAICWAQSLWTDSDPDPHVLREWYGAESALAKRHGGRVEGGSPFTESDLDDLLTVPNPAPSRIQSLATFVVWLARCDDVDRRAVEQRLATIRSFLERHESFLSLRATWLAAHALYRLSGDDVLGLARARDRALERLFEYGLSPDRDMPSFLRNSGVRAGDRFRAVRDQVDTLRATAIAWSERNRGLAASTTAQYLDLIFAFGLARLGANDVARELRETAELELPGGDPVHEWVAAAYGYRIGQAIEGKAIRDQLPDTHLTGLEKIDRLERYKIDRLRQHSRILEPHERIDPYRRWHRRYADELGRELSELTEVVDRAELTSRATELLARSNLKTQDRARTLRSLLEIGPRLGEVLTVDVLTGTASLLAESLDVVQHAALLEKGLYVAAHFDRTDDVHAFVAGLNDLLDGQRSADVETLKSLQSLLGESFRGLRRLGMRDEIAALLERMESLVGTIELPRRSKKKDARDWANALVEVQRMQLQVASGWLYFGHQSRAWPILDHVRKTLFSDDLLPVHRTSLACAYVTALGHAPVDEALPRLMQLFKELDGIRDSYTTNSHYSLSQLDVVEATVLAVAGDDASLDAAGRRWLDEDEYLIRRRIHRDVREAMGGGGHG